MARTSSRASRVIRVPEPRAAVLKMFAELDAPKWIVMIAAARGLLQELSGVAESEYARTIDAALLRRANER